MANIKISEMPEATNASSEDITMIVQNNTNKKLSMENLLKAVIPSNAGCHNSIYRGKDITSLFYDGTLSTEIEAGTFDDIFIGDYIIGRSSGIKYLVADINYRLHCGDIECKTPHVLMIPELSMGMLR